MERVRPVIFKWRQFEPAMIVASVGATIDFLLSGHRDAAAAKRFFQKALRSVAQLTPRVINVDKHPSYPARSSGTEEGRVSAPELSITLSAIYGQCNI